MGRTVLYLGHMFIRGEGFGFLAKTKALHGRCFKRNQLECFSPISMDVAYCVYGSTPSTSHCVCSDLLLNEFIFFDPVFFNPSLMKHILTPRIRTRANNSVYILIPPPSLLPPSPQFSPFQCQQYREQASVLENQPTGTFVLQVRAVDADEGANGKVKYGLMHRDSAMPAFRIHPDTGGVVTDCRGSFRQRGSGFATAGAAFLTSD